MNLQLHLQETAIRLQAPHAAAVLLPWIVLAGVEAAVRRVAPGTRRADG